MNQVSLTENRRSQWKPILAFLCILGISAGVLNARTNMFARQIIANEALLNEALPGFSENKVVELRAKVAGRAQQVAALTGLFDPRDKWTRADYDMSILFAEALNSANTELKNLAQEKQTRFSGLMFTDKLPSETDASLLLGQLYAMRLVAFLALDLGADVLLAKPLPMEKEEKPRPARAVSAEFELTFPHATVTDFFIRMNGLVPKLCGSVMKARVDEKGVYVSLRYATYHVDTPDVKGGANAGRVGVPDESYPQGIEAAVSSLRSKSPFAVPVKPVVAVIEEAPAAEETKPVQRFFYKGRAVLRKKNVAVLEDTLRGETLFLSTGDTFDAFRLKEFSDTEAVLEGSEHLLTVIKRED